MPPKIHQNEVGEAKKLSDNEVQFECRTRFTLAQINAGATLLPAIPRRQYRMINAAIISVGGAAAAGTTVDVYGTQSATQVKLFTAAQANLTQSNLVQPGATGGTILADGASFAECDVNTAITVGKTGSNFTTSTNFDILFEYGLINA